MADWVVLGTIRRARGLRGEVVASLEGSAPERFQPGLVVHLVAADRDLLATIESVWIHDGQLVLRFAGFETRDDAESLRGLQICIREAERPPAPEGEFYLSDLVGCSVETVEGRALGEVRAWHEYGAAPLLEVWDGSRELLIPFASVFYRVVDVQGRRIVTELPEGLEDLPGR